MSKKKLWMISMLAIMVIVLVSSVFSKVYSMVPSSVKSYAVMNFLAEKQVCGEAVTVDMNCVEEFNATTEQTMKLNSTFSFLPTAEASINNVKFGTIEDAVVKENCADADVFVQKIRVLNAMTSYAKLEVFVDGVSGNMADKFFAVYCFNTGVMLQEKQVESGTIVADVCLERGQFVDIAVVVSRQVAENLVAQAEPFVFEIGAKLTQV